MSLAGVKLTLVEELADVDRFREWLSERPRPILSCDTETEGLDWWRDKLRLVQIGDEQQGWAFPYPKWSGVVQEVIERYDGDLVFHNAKFDLHFLEDEGVKVGRHRVHDSRISAALVDNVRPSGLKSVASRLVDRDAFTAERALKTAMQSNKWTWATVPYELPSYWEYSALDPVLTQRIWHQLESGLEPYRNIYDVELAVQQQLLDMENRGIRVDHEYCERTIDALEGTASDLQARAEAEWSVKSLSSDVQVIKRLKADGVVFTRFTDGGRESLDKESLDSIDHPLASLVEEYRHTKKIASTYLENFVEFSDRNHLLHASINPLGARTGRMSVSRPSMQNLERSTTVRDAFIPREDHVLVLVDYDAIEYRLFAHYAGMEAILEAARQGEDMHTTTARQIYQKDDISPHERTLTKNATYAKLYGAGAPQFARAAGVTEVEAETFIRYYDQTFPEVAHFQQQLEAVTKQRALDTAEPFILTNYGRRLGLREDQGEYVLVNYLIQGTAADVLKDAILQVDLAGLSQYLLLPVHDELVFDVPLEVVDEVEPAIVEAMTISDRFKCPLTVEAQRVDRWGSKYRKGDDG